MDGMVIRLLKASSVLIKCILSCNFFSLIPEMQLEKIRVEQVEIVNRKIKYEIRMRNRNAPPDKFMLCYVRSVLYCGDNVLSSIFLFFHRKKSLSQSLNGVSIPPEPLNNTNI